MLAVLVSAINLIMPIIINLATRYEKYSNPRHELYVAVLRLVLLKTYLFVFLVVSFVVRLLYSTIIVY